MPTASPDPRPTTNVHVQGLLGVVLGVAVLGVVLLLLHLRRNGLPVDASELQMSATSPCMVQAIRSASERGTITYGELDRLKRRCGS